MRSRLDQIEARLQGLIEGSLALFARGDAQHRLAHQLVLAAQENLQSNADGQQVAPNRYTIYLHPDSLAYWQANRDRLDSIARSLQQAAWEFGVHFLGEPVLTLAPDTHLPQDGLRVVASEAYEVPGGTAAFPIQAGPAAHNIPRNAFLIVDGNRIFPLNRTVINIGRRPDNHLVLNDPRVSRAHAQIRANRGQYVLFDLNSTGGTLVNGRRVSQCALKPGDVVSLSGVPLIYGEESPDEDTEDLGFTQSMNNAEDEPPEMIG